MIIRSLLLSSFLALSFLAAALLTGLSFFASREALQREITRSLQNDAAMLMEQVDLLLFERLQNLHSWSHLEIMQEARIGDVDKRLAKFLGELKLGYGAVYRNLSFVNNDGQVLASSDPQWMGRILQSPAEAVTIQVPNGMVLLELPDPQQAPDLAQALGIRAEVLDHYGQGRLGQVYGVFDLQRIFRLFDQSANAPSGERHVALLDGRGRLLAASWQLREQGLLMSDVLSSWKSAGSPEALGVRDGAPIFQSPVLVGFAASSGFQGYAGTGWSLLVFQTTQQAFSPIQNLWWLFCISFALTALFAAWLSGIVASRLSRPLMDLSAWARNFSGNLHQPPPQMTGSREVRELGQAFEELLENLQSSRQQVIQAAKLAVVGEMAAIMAHEVRTPLGILHTTAQMLRRDADLKPRSREMTGMILEETERLGRLITTLLECASPRPPQMSRQNLHEILDRVAELLKVQALRKQIRIERDYCAQDPVISCDGELMVQVFLNLILNAIQILPRGGRIVLRSLTRENDLNIEIHDDGPGIPQIQKERVFDPFFTTREGGIGLGLTVTQQIIATHGGSIAAEGSELGGACFRICLPESREEVR